MSFDNSFIEGPIPEMVVGIFLEMTFGTPLGKSLDPGGAFQH